MAAHLYLSGWLIASDQISDVDRSVYLLPFLDYGPSAILEVNSGGHILATEELLPLL